MVPTAASAAAVSERSSGAPSSRAMGGGAEAELGRAALYKPGAVGRGGRTLRSSLHLRRSVGAGGSRVQVRRIGGPCLVGIGVRRGVGAFLGSSSLIRRRNRSLPIAAEATPECQEEKDRKDKPRAGRKAPVPGGSGGFPPRIRPTGTGLVASGFGRRRVGLERRWAIGGRETGPKDAEPDGSTPGSGRATCFDRVKLRPVGRLPLP